MTVAQPRPSLPRPAAPDARRPVSTAVAARPTSGRCRAAVDACRARCVDFACMGRCVDAAPACERPR